MKCFTRCPYVQHVRGHPFGRSAYQRHAGQHGRVRVRRAPGATADSSSDDGPAGGRAAAPPPTAAVIRVSPTKATMRH